MAQGSQPALAWSWEPRGAQGRELGGRKQKAKGCTRQGRMERQEAEDGKSQHIQKCPSVYFGIELGDLGTSNLRCHIPPQLALLLRDTLAEQCRSLGGCSGKGQEP